VCVPQYRLEEAVGDDDGEVEPAVGEQRRAQRFGVDEPGDPDQWLAGPAVRVPFDVPEVEREAHPDPGQLADVQAVLAQPRGQAEDEHVDHADGLQQAEREQ